MHRADTKSHDRRSSPTVQLNFELLTTGPIVGSIGLLYNAGTRWDGAIPGHPEDVD